MTIPRHLKPESFESLQHDPSGQCFVDLDEVNEKLETILALIGLEIERLYSAIETENDNLQITKIMSEVKGLSLAVKFITRS